MTIREALGGPWSAHWLFMALLLPPTTLVVVLREIATPFPEWWWPLASAVAQHAVAGAVIIIGGTIARRRHRIIPLATVLSIWTVSAVLRGFVAGTIAAQVTGVDPEYASRITVWLVASFVWLPVMVYAVAQFERRRAILGALDAVELELNEARPRAAASSAEVRRRLRQAVGESLSPALHDLQSSLEANRETLDRGSVAELSLRLSQLHDDAADLLSSALPAPTPRAPQLSSLRRALDVPPRLPWLTAALVAIATIVILAFDSWRIFGALAAVEVVVATIAASVTIAAVPTLIGRVRPDLLVARGQRITGIAIVLGIGVAAYVMLNSGIDPVTWHGLVIMPLLALCLTIASVTYTVTVVMADANDEADARLFSVREELEAVRITNEELIERERQRLVELMHGPVQGRIAACIMALNFHATGDSTDEQTRALTDSVLDHLRAVSRDLTSITESVGARDTPGLPR